MGAYIQIGIAHKLIVSKQGISQKFTNKDILEDLGTKINLDLYTIKHSKDNSLISLKLKQDVFVNNLKVFLLEQQDLIDSRYRKENPITDFLEILDRKDFAEIVNLIESYRCDALQPCKAQTYYFGEKTECRTTCYFYSFYAAGKAELECYLSHLKYICNLIKHGSSNPLTGALCPVLQ